jgi:hypothetical protein
MAERKNYVGPIFIGLFVLAVATATFISIFPKKSIMSNGITAMSVDMATGLVVPTEPTTNPADPYDPMPLRVGTVGATTFHRPFCPYAKKSLLNHGIENRINYWTRQQIAESKRPGDRYCMASIFDCSGLSPEEFVIAENDPWCGANIRRDNYVVEGLDAAIAGKTLCTLQGYIGVFVDDPASCVEGKVRGSNVDCDIAACNACTVDCDVICTGCTIVTMASLNKITIAMGDANRDGQESIEDYLYYHECYSGPIAATISCQNVFDIDGDSDVDVDDFDLFANSYNSGNITWASENHPNAVINPPLPEVPLRVGTVGSQYYHRLDCPSVNNSWAQHGLDKRLDFYTWDTIEASGRIADNAICLAGSRENPSGTP